ncbi:hypothetical protein V1264_015192 [Littorina saxatilis]|uniref:RING-type domain-containing protein n=2 Tax=Littorina saxatilis TaxID=31220 RepID=A0AAN9BLC6_9CAEN
MNCSRFLPDPSPNPYMNFTSLGYRLASLAKLPSSFPVSRVKLADAGFYYQGQGDTMTCFKCCVRHSGWTGEDNPMDVHRRLSPNCPYVLQENDISISTAPPLSTHIPIPVDIDAHFVPVEYGHEDHTGDVLSRNSSFAGTTRNTGRATSDPNDDRTASSGQDRRNISTLMSDNRENRNCGFQATDTTGGIQTQSRNESKTAPLEPDRRNMTPLSPANSIPALESQHNTNGATAGIIGSSVRRANDETSGRPRLELSGALYPSYQTVASRRQTFIQWDNSQAPHLNQVILSGMFYAGYADCVRCFYCGVGLRRWWTTDDVWTEHVRWKPGCRYLRAIKGDNFIQDTQRRLGIVSHGGAQDSQRTSNSAQASYHTTVSSATGSQPVVSATTTTNSTSPTAQTRPTKNNSTHPSTATQISFSSSSTSSPSSSSASAVGLSSWRRSESGGQSREMHRRSKIGRRRASVGRAGASDPPEGRLQVLSETSQACPVCYRTPTDTILFPCRCVLCESCAAPVTSCPLCSELIRATDSVRTN